MNDLQGVKSTDPGMLTSAGLMTFHQVLLSIFHTVQMAQLQ